MNGTKIRSTRALVVGATGQMGTKIVRELVALGRADAVQGLRDVVVDGQTRLLRAAENEGVAPMLPSDYALDFFRTDPA